MPETLLCTKLFIPPARPNLVPRPQLIERLNEGLQLGHKLTLISAAAGSGKTTLLSEWAAAGRRPVAWLALEYIETGRAGSQTERLLGAGLALALRALAFVLRLAGNAARALGELLVAAYDVAIFLPLSTSVSVASMAALTMLVTSPDTARVSPPADNESCGQRSANAAANRASASSILAMPARNAGRPDDDRRHQLDSLVRR